MRFTTYSTLAAGLLAATVAAGTANAQSMADHAAHHAAGPQTGMMGAGSGMMAMMQRMGMMGAAAPSSMGNLMGMLTASDLDARLAYLRTALKITPAQTAEWNAFANTLRGNAKVLSHAETQLQVTGGTITTADWIDREASLMSARAAAFKTTAGAERALSAVLTPEQNALAGKFLTGRPVGAGSART